MIYLAAALYLLGVPIALRAFAGYVALYRANGWPVEPPATPRRLVLHSLAWPAHALWTVYRCARGRYVFPRVLDW